MSKHTPGSNGVVGEGSGLLLEWDENVNEVRITHAGEILNLTYDEAGTVWRMLSYLLVPTGATGKYT
jgi:hypothetical protein